MPACLPASCLWHGPWAGRCQVATLPRDPSCCCLSQQAFASPGWRSIACPPALGCPAFLYLAGGKGTVTVTRTGANLSSEPLPSAGSFSTPVPAGPRHSAPLRLAASSWHSSPCCIVCFCVRQPHTLLCPLHASPCWSALSTPGPPPMSPLIAPLFPATLSLSPPVMFAEDLLMLKCWLVHPECPLRPPRPIPLHAPCEPASQTQTCPAGRCCTFSSPFFLPHGLFSWPTRHALVTHMSPGADRSARKQCCIVNMCSRTNHSAGGCALMCVASC